VHFRGEDHKRQKRIPHGNELSTLHKILICVNNVPINTISTLSSVGWVSSLRDVVLLNIKEGAVVVILDFAQFKKVLTCMGAIIYIKIDCEVAPGRLKDDTH
jgi:hypothetical protein